MRRRTGERRGLRNAAARAMTIAAFALGGGSTALSGPAGGAVQDTGAAAAATASPAAAPAAAGSAPLVLGMPYVVPPHLPGAKVRTPEGLAPLLAERLGRHHPLRLVVTPAAQAADAGVLPAGASAPHTDVLLLPVDAGQADERDGTVIPTGYRAGIMAIMRTDTDIHRWEDLRGRSVCLTEGGGLAGQMQARYGAIEKIFRAPADALLDLRIGGCDATVHDSTMLEALLEFPEWQKFSARLPVRQERELAFVLPGNDESLARVLRSQVQQWHDADLLARLTRQSARDIAFEVYLDQEVPDCH